MWRTAYRILTHTHFSFFPSRLLSQCARVCLRCSFSLRFFLISFFIVHGFSISHGTLILGNAQPTMNIFFSLSSLFGIGELGSILKIIALALSVNKYMHSNLFLSLFPSLLLFVYFSTFSTVPTMIHIPNVFASLQLGSSVVLLFRWAKWMQHKLNGADGLKWHKTNKKKTERKTKYYGLLRSFLL